MCTMTELMREQDSTPSHLKEGESLVYHKCITKKEVYHNANKESESQCCT